MLPHELILSRLTQIISLHFWNSFAWKTLAFRVSSLVEVSRRVVAGMRTTPLSSFLLSLSLSTLPLALSFSQFPLSCIPFFTSVRSVLLFIPYPTSFISTTHHQPLFFFISSLSLTWSFTFTLPFALYSPLNPSWSPVISVPTPSPFFPLVWSSQTSTLPSWFDYILYCRNTDVISGWFPLGLETLGIKFLQLLSKRRKTNLWIIEIVWYLQFLAFYRCYWWYMKLKTTSKIQLHSFHT